MTTSHPDNQQPHLSPTRSSPEDTEETQKSADGELPESTLPQDADQEEGLPPIPEDDSTHSEVKKRIQIKWVEGVGGEHFFDLGESILIGRTDAAQVKILPLDGDHQVSRCHAIIHSDDGKLIVKDLGSVGGTRVNGEDINAQTTLNDGDKVTLAEFLSFEVYLVDSPETLPEAESSGSTDKPQPEQQPVMAELVSPPPPPRAHSDSEAELPETASQQEEPPEPDQQVVVPGLDWDGVLQKCSAAVKGEFDFDSNDVVARMQDRLKQNEKLGMAFDEHREDVHHQAFKITQLPPEDADLWFVGDIHGDLLGMESSLAYIQNHAAAIGKKPWVVFLGDFIDRGPHSHEVMLRVFHYVLENLETTTAILGNHDEGFCFDKENNRFLSHMDPCEYPEWLNKNQKDELAVKTGKLAIEFFNKIPKAFFLPDGLIVAHGCVPHKDLTPGFESEGDLNGDLALQDYVNARISPKAPRKRPNRTSKTHQLGREDFENFCKKASEILKQPVRRMIKGHEHIELRYDACEKFVDYPMLVINNMCSMRDDTTMGDGAPCVARWKKNRRPEVHQVQIPRHIINEFYSGNGESPEDNMPES